MPRLIGTYNWDSAEPEVDQNSGVLGDTGTDLKIGVGQLKQATYALGDLAARPFRSEDDETFSEKLAQADENEIGSDAWMAKKRAEYSQARQESERDYEATKESFGDSALGQFGGTLYGLVTNPRAGFGRVVQSAPATVAGGGVGGAAAKAATALGLSARGAMIATVGSAAGEGIQSGANNAYNMLNYNRENGRARYEGVGGGQVLTAVGVGATSLLGAKVGGGIEASLFNKEARQALKMGNKGTVRAAAVESGEEAVQSVWEDVPQNIGMDKPWDEGLYSNMAEGAFAGGAMGGGVHLGHRLLGTAGPQSMLDQAPTNAQAQQAQAQQQPQQEAPVETESALNGTAVDPARAEAQPSPEEVSTKAVQQAAEETPMAGTQPVEPVMPPQPSPEEIKAQQQALEQATKDYRQRYGLAKDVAVTPEEVQADLEFRNANAPATLQVYDAAMRANGVVEQGKQIAADALRKTVTLEPISNLSMAEIADQLDKAEQSYLDEGDTEQAVRSAVTAAVLRDPKVDANKFAKERRKQYEEDAQAKAQTQAAQTYMEQYGHKPKSSKEVNDDADWRRRNAGAVPLLDAMIKAREMSGSRLSDAKLREEAGWFYKGDPEATLKGIDAQREQSQNILDHDFYDAVGEILRNPETAMEHLLTKQKARTGKSMEEQAAKTEAALEAHNKKMEAKAAAEAEKAKTKKEAPKAETKPTPKEEAKPVETPKAEPKAETKPTPKEEAKPESKVEEKKEAPKPVEKKEEAKPAPKEATEAKPAEPEEEAKPSTPTEVFESVASDPELVGKMHKAGIFDKRRHSFKLEDISTPKFQEKVNCITDPEYIPMLEKLRELAQLVDPSYKLNIPSKEQVQSNAYDAAVTEGGKLTRLKRSSAPKSTEEADALLRDYFMSHQATAHRLYKETQDPTGKSPEEIADALVESLSAPKKKILRTKYLRLARHAKEAASEDTEVKEVKTKKPEEPKTSSDTEPTADEARALEDAITLESLTRETSIGQEVTREDGTMAFEGDDLNSSETGSIPDGTTAGDNLAKKIADAYEAAELPDLSTTPVKELFKKFKEIESAVVKEFPSKLTYYVGEEEEFNSDGIGQALMRYMEFMDKFLANAPEEVKSWVHESPFVKWGLKQMDRHNPKPALSMKGADPEADAAIAKGSVALSALLKKRHGDGGWFKQETEAQIQDDLRSRQRSPEGQKIFSKATYWSTPFAQGVAVPLRYAVSTSKNLEADLATIVDPRVAKTVAYAVERFKAVGKAIPDVYIVDLSRQVIPSKSGLDAGGLSNVSFAFYGQGAGYGRLLESGRPELVASRNLVCISMRTTPETTAEGSLEHIGYWKNTTVHEFLHAEDADAQRQTGAPLNLELGRQLEKSNDAAILRGLAEVIAMRDAGHDVEAWFNANPSPYNARIRELMAKVTPEEAEYIKPRFSYPTERAVKMSNEGYSVAECDQAYWEETYAVFVSAMFDGTSSEAFLRENFPELTKILTPFVTGKGTGTTNASRTQNTQRVSPQRPLAVDERQGVRTGRGEETEGSTPEAGTEAGKPTDSKEAFKEKFINEQLKHGTVAAKNAGIDPALYETEEWKAHAQAYAEAAYAAHQADGSVGGCKAALNKASTPLEEAQAHRKLHDAMRRQEEAQLKQAKARQAFNDFEDAHRKKVETNGTAPKQMDNQFAYNKVAEAVAKRLHAPWLREVINKAGDWAYHHGLAMLFTRELVDVVKDKLHSAVEWARINNLIDQVARTHQDKAVKIGQDFRNLSKKEQDDVNALLKSSVLNGEWYAIPVDKDGKPIAKAEVTSNEEFNKLSDAAKKVYCDVLRMGTETRALIRKYTLENIIRRYDERIAKAGDPEKAAKLEKQRDQAMDRINSILPDSDKPYVPLRRFGKYVVTLKSQDYLDAVAKYHAAKDAAEADGATARDRREVEEARQTVLTMQANGKDYIVEYAETSDEAMVRSKELEKEYGGTGSYFERSEFMKSEQVAIHQLLNLVDKTERQVDGVDDDFSGHSRAVKEKLNELATTLYIQSLADTSALKSRLKRRKVAGASDDMMRSFMAQASSESRYLGYLKHGADLRKALSAMEDEVRTSDQRLAASTVFNEIRKRVEQDMTPQGTATNGILRTTSVMMLLTNPAFFLQNLTQPLLYSATYMAGRFGLHQPLALTARQMRLVAMWVKADGTLSDLDKLVETKQITSDERDMLITMRENGLLDIGLSQEFGEFDRDSLSPIMGKLAGFTDMLAGAARKVEIINRVSSALVAYRLEKARQVSKGADVETATASATDYADHVLYETHGDYSSRNAPRYFKINGFARVVTQFRKFQLIQLGLFARMLKQALDKAPSEERTFARRGLTYTMGAFLAVTGVKGLPLYGVMAVALGLGGDPGDDDEDVLRKTLADAGCEKPVIDLIVRGLPAMLGLDLSDKLGAGNVLSPFPYLEGNKLSMKNGPDDALEVLAQVLGPAASLLVRGSRGMSYGWQGDYTKAAENLLPSGFANVVKATRFGLEGLTTKAGDVVIPGEEFTFGDLIMQGVGLPTTKVTGRNQLVSSLYRHEETYNQWAKQIRYSFTQAVKSHDIRARSEAVKEWKQMNEMRRRAGFAPNKLSNLTGSVKAQRTRERGAIGGVETNKSNRGFVRKASELY